jgi:DNA adenine methylase
MALSAFPYVGGKTRLVNWIVDHLPEHTVFVEPFGGSAAVLLNKPRSKIEVFNDRDGEIVHFFEVAREHAEELAEWCRRTPYSEQLHNQWVRQFYAGEPPSDPIERAGRFVFLRYTQWSAKYSGPSGFKRDTPRARQAESEVWRDVPERIAEVCDRLQGVSIQSADYRDVIERYDEPETVFYCDPPYLDKEETYGVDGFDHSELAGALRAIQGYAIVSYTDRPEGLYDGWLESTREFGHDAGNRTGHSKEVTERLLLNYDPNESPDFTDARQALITEMDSRKGRSQDTDSDRTELSEKRSGGDS